jgi:hypothetical protein
MKKLFLTTLLGLATVGCQQQTPQVVNRATCLQAQQAYENAKYQQDMLDQQLVLAAISSNEVERNEANKKQKELKGAMLMFGRIMEDPQLDCSKYLNETK